MITSLLIVIYNTISMNTLYKPTNSNGVFFVIGKYYWPKLFSKICNLHQYSLLNVLMDDKYMKDSDRGIRQQILWKELTGKIVGGWQDFLVWDQTMFLSRLK